jgi:hypothetical protein
MKMPPEYKISARHFGEYLEALARCQEVPMEHDSKARELFRSYAEFKFRVEGGSRCAVCQAHVRHVVAVTAEYAGGDAQRFPCLCTRCFEGEKAKASRMFLEIGDNRVEVKLRAEDRSSTTLSAAARAAKASKSQ